MKVNLYWEKNLNALDVSWPLFKEQLLAACSPTWFEQMQFVRGGHLSKVDFIFAANQEKTLSVIAAPTANYQPALQFEINGIPLHSRVNPLRPLRSPDPDKVAVLLGFGGGFDLLPQLKQRLPFLALEPHALLWFSALHFFDLAQPLAEKKLRPVLTTSNEDYIWQLISQVGSETYTFFPHRACLTQLGERPYLQLRHQFWNLVDKRSVNMTTLVKFEKLWTSNLIQNHIRFHASSNKEPHNGFQSIQVLIQKWRSQFEQAILFCAGPSLTTYGKSFLAEFKKLSKSKTKLGIVCVDTALKPLLNAGIVPDLVFCVDPQKYNRIYFLQENPPFDLAADLCADPVSLALSACSHKNIYTWKSPFALAAKLEYDYAELGHGGSVSTNALDFLWRCQFENIWMIGQDLAYTNQLAHCPGAVGEARHALKVNRLTSLESLNFLQMHAIERKTELTFAGQKTITTEKMLIFRDWIESRLAKHRQEHPNHQVTVIGEHGLKIRGCKHITWLESQKLLNNSFEYPTKAKSEPNISPSEQGQAEASKPKLDELQLYQLIAQLNHRIALIQKSKSKIQSAIQLAHSPGSIRPKNQKQQPNNNGLGSAQNKKKDQLMAEYLNQLDRLDRQIMADKEISEWVSPLMQGAVHQLDNQSRDQEDPLLNSLNLYEAMLTATTQLQFLMTRTLARR